MDLMDCHLEGRPMLSHVVRLDSVMSDLLDIRRSAKVQRRVMERVLLHRCLQCDREADGAVGLCIAHDASTRRRLAEIRNSKQRVAARCELIRRGLLLAPYEVKQIKRDASSAVARAIDATK
jgi:hypothetical protein